MLVIRILLKLKSSTVLHELLELRRLTLAKLIKTRLKLLLLDVTVLLILSATWQSLPGKASFQEVQKHMSNSLKIISS